MTIAVRGVCPLLQVFDMPTSLRFYRDIFGFWHNEPCQMRNILWCTFTEPEVRARYLNFEDEAPRTVAQFRAASANHLGEPATGPASRRPRAAPRRSRGRPFGSPAQLESGAQVAALAAA